MGMGGYTRTEFKRAPSYHCLAGPAGANPNRGRYPGRAGFPSPSTAAQYLTFDPVSSYHLESMHYKVYIKASGYRRLFIFLVAYCLQRHSDNDLFCRKKADGAHDLVLSLTF
jgi:hypothetical protein